MVTGVEDRWQTKIKSISEGIQHIFDSKEFADVTFFVRGTPFKAHKLVLASRSSELARLLMSNNASDEIVVPKTISQNGFRVFLSFIYTNNLNAVDKKSVVEAYHCAKYYEQKALISKCLQEIESWEIDVEDACDLLDVEWDIPALREKCISFVRENGPLVVTSDVFVNSSGKTLSAVLTSGALAEVPVFQRVKSVMDWGKRHLTITDADYSLVRQKLLDNDPPLLGMLEIENLKIEEFPLLLQKYPKLLTDKEISQLILYMGSRNPVDLPSWCTKK